MEPEPARRPLVPRVIAGVAVAVLVVGVWAAARQWGAGHERPQPPRDRAASVDTVGDPVPQALSQAGGADEKTRWVDELTEVDLASLDAPRREVFLRHANTRHCSCGCGYTLAACRVYDSSCDKSLPRVRALFDSVSQGRIADAQGQRERPLRR